MVNNNVVDNYSNKLTNNHKEDAMIHVVNVATGEVTEFADSTPEEIKDSWLMISKQIQALERAKDKLKPKVAELLDEFGKCEIGDYMFRQMTVQRRNYDKGLMRQELDEDTFDSLLIPDKTAVDRYIKENLEELGNTSTLLRNYMVDVGQPYSVTKLEQIK